MHWFLISWVVLGNLLWYKIYLRFSFIFHNFDQRNLIFLFRYFLLPLQFQFSLIFKEFVHISRFGPISSCHRLKCTFLHFDFIFLVFEFFNPVLFELLVSKLTLLYRFCSILLSFNRNVVSVGISFSTFGFIHCSHLGFASTSIFLKLMQISTSFWSFHPSLSFSTFL